MMPNDSPDTPLALRPREAARMLSVSERTLWEWTRAGLIPCARIGNGKRKTVLYSIDDLRAWLERESRKVEGGGE